MISTAWRLLPSCVLPLAPLEAAVDRDRAALGEEAGAVLALRAPDRDVEVVRLVLPLARGVVLAARVARDRAASRRTCRSGRSAARDRASGCPVRTTRLMLVAATVGLLSLSCEALGWPSLGRGSGASTAQGRRLGGFLDRVLQSARNRHEVAACGGAGAMTRRDGPRLALRRRGRLALDSAGCSAAAAVAAARGPAAAGVPGRSLMIRKRRTPSVIFSVWSSCSSSSGVPVELDQVVVRVGVLVHLVRRRRGRPSRGGRRSRRCGRSTSARRSRGSFVAALVLGLGVEQEDQVVDRLLRWPCGGGC